MRHLLEASAALSPGTADGLRVPGADEDVLVALSAALDGLTEGPRPAPGGLDLELVAPLPESLDWALGTLVASDLSLIRGDQNGAALAASLAAAEKGEAGDCLVLAATGYGDPSADGASPSPPGAGAVAFHFREGEGPSLSELLGSLRDEPSALRAAFDLSHRAPDALRRAWVGEWDADPATGLPIDLAREAPLRDRAPAGKSEGAYISRPRYRETAGLHWRFTAEECPRCAFVTFPARGACRSCGNLEGLRRVDLPRKGLSVVATTIIGPGGQPTEFDPQVEALGPYEVVLAELAPGIRVTLMVADAAPGAVRIGDRVDSRLRRIYAMDGEWRYGRKAVPTAAR